MNCWAEWTFAEMLVKADSINWTSFHAQPDIFWVRQRKAFPMPLSIVGSSVDIHLKSVLLATDLSETSQKPLRHALAIARHYGAKFYLAHVVSSPGFMIAGPQALELATEAATRDLQQLEHDLTESGLLAGIDHEFIVREGVVWEELQSIVSQNQIELLVLGTHGRNGIGKMLLGSVAENAFRHADCLVLTVGPNSYPSPFSRTSPNFLFATDFGEGSLRALHYAISLANHFGAKLLLLHVVPTATTPENFSHAIPAMRDAARMARLRQLEQFVRGDQEMELPPEFIVHFGLPSERILQVALEHKADLIIMGLRRSTHIATASRVPWATAYEVVCNAGCPVLTVRAQQGDVDGKWKSLRVI
jgi:nucleotide-binding universal stress UspA family protein